MERRRNFQKSVAAEVVPATCVDDVPDDLLDLILRRLDSPIWLIRAASTCKRWRGIIVADDDGSAFLRRARSLHPHPRIPTIVGHYHQRATSIEFIPTSPIDASRFSLNFLLPLGATTKWELKDCHGGLVLLLQHVEPRYLVVCDPLTRWYRKLNVSTMRGQDQQLNGHFFLLIEGDNGGAISASNFRVFYRNFHYVNAPRSYVFSTAGHGGSWRAVPPSKDDDFRAQVTFAGRADGYLYMGTECGSVMALDSTSLELTKIHLPSLVNTPLGSCGPSAFCVVAHCDGGDCTSPCIIHVKCDELEVFRRVHGGSGDEWVLEHTIHRLSKAFCRVPGYPTQYDWIPKVVVGGDRFVVLLVCDYGQWRWPFSVCLDTMEVKAVPELTCYRGTSDCSVYSFPWPPFIRACIGQK